MEQIATNKEQKINYEYIFEISFDEVKSVIYDVGTKYNKIIFKDDKNCLLVDRYNNANQKNVSRFVIEYLMEVSLFDEKNNCLTPEGKKIFEELYINNNQEQVSNIFIEKTLENPVVNLIFQVFYGKDNICIEQLIDLLNYHHILEREVIQKDVVKLLIYLNKFNIVSYDKKNRKFKINDVYIGKTTNLLKQYYVNPTTPFSNIYSMRKIIRSCKGEIYWIDKHFRKEAFEILLDGLPPSDIASVHIISSDENLTVSAKNDFLNLKKELTSRNVKLLWSIIDDCTFKWHDRWIVSDNLSYNIPPVLAIIRGQRSEFLKTDNSNFDIQSFLSAISYEVN